MDDDLLAQVPLFAALDVGAWESLEPSLSHVVVARGDVVFAEGQPGDALFVIEDGKVKISRSAPDGRENLLSVLGPTEMFGELSLFDPSPRTASAIAVTEGRLLKFPHDALRPWLRQRPEVAPSLLQALAQRLRRTNEALADLVFSDVPGRVAKTLLSLADRFGHTESDGIRVSHDLTQEELAQLVGASRETVNKALADFAARGWLRLDGRSVVLLAPDRLAHRAR